ncbi:TraB/GumN family protein [Vibrio mangrovi]|uniref:TraB family protein n=1 Tax=Vibrio mangrovi TaxID=474394 RepID=A0A1Y6IV61_9VIBR|nr:TraB/GumN family protein [Vibrio mangrovi]MDW6001592.1 TraB/GumN family protein [Vibrio mangrovi]SMS00382.1 TraB family protein [Vibrio mangrovi]
MQLSRLLSAGALFLSFYTTADPLYWLASKNQLQLMLLGSVHVGHPDMYPLPTPVMDFLHESDGLIVEADIRQANTLQYPPVKWTSQQVLSPPQLQKLDSIASQLKLNAQRLRQSPPWQTAISLQMQVMNQAGYQPELGIDQYMIHQAETESIPVIGLESLQSQIDILAGLDQDGKELLTSTLEEWGETTQETDCLVTSWHQGDLEQLKSLIDHHEMSQEMSRQLEIKRNHHWLEQLTSPPIFSPQPAKYLVVVGTLHLIGQENLIQLLKEQGFTVTRQNTIQNSECRISQDNREHGQGTS